MYLSAVASDRHSTPINRHEACSLQMEVRVCLELPHCLRRNRRALAWLHCVALAQALINIFRNSGEKCDAATSPRLFGGTHVLEIVFGHRCGALPKVRAKSHHSASSAITAYCRIRIKFYRPADVVAGYNLVISLMSLLYPLVQA